MMGYSEQTMENGVLHLHGMGFRLNVLVVKLEGNNLSVDTPTVDGVRAGVAAAKDSADDGFTTVAYCNRDCRRIAFDDEPNSASSSLTLANGLFFI